MSNKVLAATVSVASNTTLVALKLIVGLMTGSVSIISEAAHSALDLFAAIIAFFSVRESGRPADKEHPFGHGKIENLSGAIEAMLILLAAMFIIHEAIDKLKHPEDVRDPMLGLYVMAISVVLNIVVSKYLFRVARKTDSIALEADAHHLSTDVWTSIGVFVGMALIKLTDLHILDPLVAIAVALMIVRVAFSLTWKAAAPLLDTRLPDDEISELEDIVMSTPGVRSYHKLRTRKAGPYRQVDFHVIVPANMPVQEAHAIAERIEGDIRRKFPDAHIVSHIEPDTEDLAPVSDSPDTSPARGES